jgi:hypothetical protein
LSFQLGGLMQGSQYGFMNVNGIVTLGGQLELVFVNGFGGSVTSNDNFTLINSNSSLAGAFTNAPSGTRLTTSDGSGSFVVSYSENTLSISGFGRLGAAQDSAAAAPMPRTGRGWSNTGGLSAEEAIAAGEAQPTVRGRVAASVPTSDAAADVLAAPAAPTPASATPALVAPAAAVLPATSQTPPSLAAPVPSARVAGARAQTLSPHAMLEMQRPMRDPSRRFGVQVRDSDQLLALVESAGEENTARGPAAVRSRSNKVTPERASEPASVGQVGGPANAGSERAASRVGIRASASAVPH